MASKYVKNRIGVGIYGGASTVVVVDVLLVLLGGFEVARRASHRTRLCLTVCDGARARAWSLWWSSVWFCGFVGTGWPRCYSCLMPHIDRNVLKFCKLTAGTTV